MKKVIELILITSLVFTLFISCDYTPFAPEDDGVIDNVDPSYINTGFSENEKTHNIIFDINAHSTQSKTYWGDPKNIDGVSTKTISSISSTIKKNEGSENAPCGIIFLKNNPSNEKNTKDMFFIAVMITSSGKYSVVRFNGTSWKYLIPLTPSDAINVGVSTDERKVENKIEVVYPKNLITGEDNYFTTNNVFTLKINDKEVTTFVVVDKEESENKKFVVPPEGYNCYVAVTFPRNGSYTKESITFTPLVTN